MCDPPNRPKPWQRWHLAPGPECRGGIALPKGCEWYPGWEGGPRVNSGLRLAASSHSWFYKCLETVVSGPLLYCLSLNGPDQGHPSETLPLQRRLTAIQTPWEASR